MISLYNMPWSPFEEDLDRIARFSPKGQAGFFF
jgi:hypothetical protein